MAKAAAAEAMQEAARKEKDHVQMLLIARKEVVIDSSAGEI